MVKHVFEKELKAENISSWSLVKIAYAVDCGGLSSSRLNLGL